MYQISYRSLFQIRPKRYVIGTQSTISRQIDTWVHAAAVFGLRSKRSSGRSGISTKSGISVDLVPTSKHLDELSPYEKCHCIGFKLESGIKTKLDLQSHRPE